MKVVCRHGHYAFYPSSKEDVIHFQRLFKLEIVAEDDYFTFPALKGLPRWSQIARPYGDAVAIATCERPHAWEVMEKNNLVYSLALGILVVATTITKSVTLKQTRDCAIAPKPLVQAGSLLPTGNVLLGYRGELDLRLQRLYVYSQDTLL